MTVLLVHLRLNKASSSNRTTTNQITLLAMLTLYHHNKSSQASSVHAFTNSFLSKISMTTLQILLVPALLTLVYTNARLLIKQVTPPKRTGSWRSGAYGTATAALLLLGLQFTLNFVCTRNIFQYTTNEGPILTLITTVITANTTTAIKKIKQIASIHKHVKWWIGILSILTLKINLTPEVIQNAQIGYKVSGITGMTAQSVRVKLGYSSMWYAYQKNYSTYKTVKYTRLHTQCNSVNLSQVVVITKHSSSVFLYPTTRLVPLQAAALMVALTFRKSKTTRSAH